MKKKILIILLVVLILTTVAFIVLALNNKQTKEKTMIDLINDTEENEFIVDNYSIFGTHYNINACTDKIIDNQLYLVLRNLDEEIDMNGTFYNEEGKTCFKISDKYNTGIDLDSLKQGEFVLMVKEEIKDSGDKESNNTDFYNFKNLDNFLKLKKSKYFRFISRKSYCY